VNVVVVVEWTMCSAGDRDYSLDLYVDFCLDLKAGCSLARDCWFAFDTLEKKSFLKRNFKKMCFGVLESDVEGIIGIIGC